MSNMLELFKVGASLVLDKADFDRGISEADESGKGLADKLKGYADKISKFLKGSAVVGAVVGVSKSIWNLAKETSAAGDRIDKQSQALGMSRKAYQEWDYILRQSGASIDSMGMSMRTMSAAISENSAETASGLAKLGLSAAHLQSLSPEDQFEELVRAFQQMPEGAEKTQLAMQLFGRNAQGLMPLLNSSADSVDELRQRAHDLGLIMSDEDVDASVAFGDALDDLNAVWGALKQKFGAQMLPTLTKGLVAAANALGRITNAVEGAFKTGDWKGVFTAITEEISNILPGVLDTVIGILGGIFENADKLIDLAMSIVEGLTDGIVKALPKLIAKLPEILNRILNGLKNSLTSLGNGIIDILNSVLGTNIPDVDVLVGWVQTGWEDVKAAFNVAVEWVGRAWNDTVTWVQNAWKAVGDAFTAASEWVDRAWTDTVNWVQTAWNDVSNAFTDAGKWVGKAFQTTVTWVQKKWNAVSGAIASASEWVGEKAHEIWMNFSANVAGWINRIWKWLTGDTSSEANQKGNAITVAFNVLEKLLPPWLVKVWNLITGKQNIADVKFSITDIIPPWIKKIWALITGESSDGVANTNGNTAKIKFLDGEIGGWIKKIDDWINNGIQIAVDFLGNLFGSSDGTVTQNSPEDPMGVGISTSYGTLGVDGHIDPATGAWVPHAKGLNYVPWDGYRAILHRGETVLNQAQSRDWRNSNSGIDPQQLYRAVADAVAAAVGSIGIDLDGKSVGRAVSGYVSQTIYSQQMGRRVPV